MKDKFIAMPIFEERISPLLDVSERFVLYEINDGAVTQKVIISINAENERVRMLRLKELGVGVIISGAVSRYMCHIISETGIRHIPWISGPVDVAINSYINDSLQSVLPGNGSCGGMMRRRRLVKDQFEDSELKQDKNGGVI